MLNQMMNIVNELKSKDIILNGHGIFDKRALKKWNTSPGFLTSNQVCLPFTAEDIMKGGESIMKAIKIIPYLVIKTTRKGLVSSYGLKHVIEKTFYVEGRGSYLENGEAILAMLFLKYGMILSQEGSWNCTFHCNYAKNDYAKGYRQLESWEKF